MSRSLIAILLIIGAVLIGVFYLKPEWDSFQQLRRETERLQELSGEFDDLIQNRDALISKVNSVSKTDLDRIETMIPKDPQAINYLISVENLARQTGIAFTSFDVEAGLSGTSGTPKPVSNAPQPVAVDRGPEAVSQPINTLHTLDLSISLGGTYEALKVALQTLERHLRITDIQSFTFPGQRKPADLTQAPIYIYALKVKAYYE